MEGSKSWGIISEICPDAFMSVKMSDTHTHTGSMPFH